MSAKEKKMTKAADASSKPEEQIANRLIKELDRVHVRTPRF